MNINTTTHQVVKIETSSSKLIRGGVCEESTFPTKNLKTSYIIKSHDNSYGIWSAVRDWWLFKMVFLCHEHSSYPTSSFTAFKCYEHSSFFWAVLVFHYAMLYFFSMFFFLRFAFLDQSTFFLSNEHYVVLLYAVSFDSIQLKFIVSHIWMW